MAAVYDNIFAYVDGKLLSENTKVTLAGEPDDQIVDTTVKGFSGISPTAKRLRISLENVSPPTGDEVPWFERYFKSTPVEVKLQKGNGEKLTTNGFIQSPSTTAGVSTTTATSLVVVCDPAWWA